MSNGKLNGKVAVVTGASKGIGAGIAKALGAEGASVVVNYASDKAGADKTVADIVKDGGKAVAVKGDVSKLADVKHLFAETKKAFGKVDVLVNNAGVYKFSPLEQITEEEFQRQFGINVWGTIQATREALPLFGNEGGSVINISSVVSRKAIPGSAVYSGTKGAVDTVTQVLAAELGPRRIRVNAINPGMVESEGTHAAGFIGSDFQRNAEASSPLGRIGQPQDIASVAVFLAANDSSWLTGEHIVVSGGF
ncbi:MAG: oxidoreductase [Alphaproteobacteria bacterium 64-11]|nr:glucose 1-dehydrogenase [Alphaproteobacteria bacterium]OJU09873.1 MAG: oxidoreductase [Alphaproteobacteria bacterium 64-11]